MYRSWEPWRTSSRFQPRKIGLNRGTGFLPFDLTSRLSLVIFLNGHVASRLSRHVDAVGDPRVHKIGTRFPSVDQLIRAAWPPTLPWMICAMVKSRYIGDGHPTFNRNPYNGYINPYYWVDDPPLLYGNNGSLDPGTYGRLVAPLGLVPTILMGLPMAPTSDVEGEAMPLGSLLRFHDHKEDIVFCLGQFKENTTPQNQFQEKLTPMHFWVLLCVCVFPLIADNWSPQCKLFDMSQS